MSATQPFSPHQGSTLLVTIAANGTQIAAVDRSDRNLRVSNSGAAPVHFRTYSSRDTTPPVATAADTVVLANGSSTFTKPLNHDLVSFFSTAGTTVYVATGEGW